MYIYYIILTATIGNVGVLASNKTCNLSLELMKEISSYDEVVKKIVSYVLDGPFKNKTYNDLEDFVDEFGPRLAGSDVLEKSIDYIVNKSLEYGLNVHTENVVNIPHWVRGYESAVMIEPRYQKLQFLGLGKSISTPPEGITADAIVVRSFKDLNKLPSSFISGKIVVYNQAFTTYSGSAKYRRLGATKASAKGAVAVLVRSVTPFSLGTPHTGMQTYTNNTKPIPVGSITVEDSELLYRIYKRGKKIVIKIVMSSTLDTATSRNTLIDIIGATKPENMVIVSGHIDSWDVGQGAMDDGAGAFISWAVPQILNKLDLKPKRTIRTILWTAEEVEMVGANSYVNTHRNEVKNINFALEADEGTFRPTGLEVSANREAVCIISEILKLFKFINSSGLKETPTPGSDITVLLDLGVPGAGLMNENKRYFWFHHSNADSMTVLDSGELDLATAFWTAVSYVIADLSIDIPKSLNTLL